MISSVALVISIGDVYLPHKRQSAAPIVRLKHIIHHAHSVFMFFSRQHTTLVSANLTKTSIAARITLLTITAATVTGWKSLNGSIEWSVTTVTGVQTERITLTSTGVDLGSSVGTEDGQDQKAEANRKNF